MVERNQKNKVSNGQNLGFAILIIIILALIVLNFGNITGKTTAESKSKIEMKFPSVIGSRDVIDITVIPSKNTVNGYFPDLDIIDEEGKPVGGMTVKKIVTYNDGKERFIDCGEHCKEKATITTALPELPRSKDGERKEYFFRVLDWDVGEQGAYVDFPFVVIQSYN